MAHSLPVKFRRKSLPELDTHLTHSLPSPSSSPFKSASPAKRSFSNYRPQYSISPSSSPPSSGFFARSNGIRLPSFKSMFGNIGVGDPHLTDDEDIPPSSDFGYNYSEYELSDPEPFDDRRSVFDDERPSTSSTSPIPTDQRTHRLSISSEHEEDAIMALLDLRKRPRLSSFADSESSPPSLVATVSPEAEIEAPLFPSTPDDVKYEEEDPGFTVQMDEPLQKEISSERLVKPTSITALINVTAFPVKLELDNPTSVSIANSPPVAVPILSEPEVPSTPVLDMPPSADDLPTSLPRTRMEVDPASYDTSLEIKGSSSPTSPALDENALPTSGLDQTPPSLGCLVSPSPVVSSELQDEITILHIAVSSPQPQPSASPPENEDKMTILADNQSFVSKISQDTSEPISSDFANSSRRSLPPLSSPYSPASSPLSRLSPSPQPDERSSPLSDISAQEVNRSKPAPRGVSGKRRSIGAADEPRILKKARRGAEAEPSAKEDCIVPSNPTKAKKNKDKLTKTKSAKTGPRRPKPESSPIPTLLTPDERDELTGLVIETLAMTRASSTDGEGVWRGVVDTRPHLKTKRPKAEWDAVLYEVLEFGVGVGYFGAVASSGKDERGNSLPPRYFYVPEKDPDAERAKLLKEMMPRSGRRSESVKYKQYYWKPLDKWSRWDAEEEI